MSDAELKREFCRPMATETHASDDQGQGSKENFGLLQEVCEEKETQAQDRDCNTASPPAEEVAVHLRLALKKHQRRLNEMHELNRRESCGVSCGPKTKRQGQVKGSRKRGIRDTHWTCSSRKPLKWG